MAGAVRDDANRRASKVGAAADEAVAERQPAHADREHDGLRLHRAAQHERQVLRPDHFIDQGGGARTKEKEQDHNYIRPPEKPQAAGQQIARERNFRKTAKAKARTGFRCGAKERKQARAGRKYPLELAHRVATLRAS